MINLEGHEALGVPAVRAVPSDKATFSSCVAGEYRFGNATHNH